MFGYQAFRGDARAVALQEDCSTQFGWKAGGYQEEARARPNLIVIRDFSS